MSDRRAWRLDLAASVLLCAGLLVGLAILTQGPADNVLGPVGARLAQALLLTLGVAVYVWLAAWFVLVLLLFLRRSCLAWSLRLLGWLLLMPSVAVFAQRWGPPQAASPFGPGGALGAWLRLWMDEQ